MINMILDLLRKVLGVKSPSRHGMSKKEWEQLHKEAAEIAMQAALASPRGVEKM